MINSRVAIRLSPQLGRRAAAVPVRSGTLEGSRPNLIEGTPRHVELPLGLFAPLTLRLSPSLAWSDERRQDGPRSLSAMPRPGFW
jgi:hypothetical protein